jgi:hypothetical protein
MIVIMINTVVIEYVLICFNCLLLQFIPLGAVTIWDPSSVDLRNQADPSQPTPLTADLSFCGLGKIQREGKFMNYIWPWRRNSIWSAHDQQICHKATSGVHAVHPMLLGPGRNF